MPEPSAQDEFAWVYNKIWGPYASQAIQILDELLLKQLPPRARFLDLCCGTGQLSNLLTNRGYQVTGIDSSEAMIRFARRNAPDAMFVIQDARQFCHPESYDAIVSIYDSLNFITIKEDLIDVFQNVISSLKPGGWFLFDLNTESGYLDHWEDGIFDIVEDDHVCVVHASYDPEERSAQFDVTIFRLHDVWRRSDLTLVQRCYSKNQITESLEIAGFEDITIHGYHDEKGLTELTPESDRMYFVSRKPLREFHYENAKMRYMKWNR
ncbi:MAG: class I SAM-dependent methyltransferase [Chloroflexi bacterium]|nr:class I SAM-dependent methyltransferase [Chloroflexota bacterium]